MPLRIGRVVKGVSEVLLRLSGKRLVGEDKLGNKYYEVVEGS